MNKHKGNSISELKMWNCFKKKKRIKTKTKKITEMKAQWSIGKWIKLEAWIGAELTHPRWRTRPAFVSWARRWDRRWIVASDPFGFLGIRVFFRAGNVRKRGGKLWCVRTVGKIDIGALYREEGEDVFHVHCTWYTKKYVALHTC